MFGISLVDLLFIVTTGLLVFNGLRNGFIRSLVNLISLPLALAVAWFFGPNLTALLAANNLPSTPVIAFLALFFGTVLIVHLLSTVLSGIVKSLPLFGLSNSLLGGIVGFVESWLLWVVLLLVLGNILQDVHNFPGGILDSQFSSWQTFYNQAITGSLFAQVNSFIIHTVPVSALHH